MRLYIAGPMTGIPQFNFPKFRMVATLLRAWNHDVVSPSEIDDPVMREACLSSGHGTLEEVRTWLSYNHPSFEAPTYGALLGRDIQIVLDEVDAIMVLDGWEESKGARIEVFTAVQAGKDVYSYQTWLNLPGNLDHRALLSADELDDALHAYLRPQTPPGSAGERFTKAWSEIKADSTERIEKRLEETREERAKEAHARIKAMAEGEVRTVSATGGEKGVKPERLDLIPPEALEELGRVYGRGAEKYSDNNYLKGYEWRKSAGAALRHWARWLAGEDIDEETGCHHLMHAAWHCFTLYTFQTSTPKLGVDDRIFHSIIASQDGELK